jgi:hypothetical protein
MFGELFPTMSGVVLGAVLAFVRMNRSSKISAALLALLLASIATVASGEWDESPLFLLIDILEVSAAAVFAHAMVSWTSSRVRMHVRP